MTPVLYESNASVFSNYGLGALTDTLTCEVSEALNGSFELVLTYPITGKLYEDLQAERIIKAKAHDTRDDQLFRIYRITRPIRGIVTVYAQHISYDLSGVALAPFSGTYSAASAMAYIFTGTPFTGISDKAGTKTVGTSEPLSIRSMLGGTAGSLLDLWGGEYTFDNFKVYLNVNRGSDKGVVIEYGKNLTQLEADNDLSGVYSELLPYATVSDDDGVEHTVVAPKITITSVITRTKTLIKNFGDQFTDVPTQAQVTSAANTWLSANPLGYETPSLKVSFVPTAGGIDYPASAAHIDLADTVTIRYTALGVSVKAKIVETVYNTLTESYKSITVGKPRANMANSVAAIEQTVKEVQQYPSKWSDAIAVATRLITGNEGGHVILHAGPDGEPYELLVMDTADISTAVNVWRWNVNGLGYSSSGYNGPYATAITADGSINADFITTGTISADLIQSGVLEVLNQYNEVLFRADKDANTVQIGSFTVNNQGLKAYKNIRVPRDMVVDIDEFGGQVTHYNHDDPYDESIVTCIYNNGFNNSSVFAMESDANYHETAYSLMRSNGVTVWDGTNTTVYGATGPSINGSGVVLNTGGTMTGQLKTSFKNSVAMGSYQATATTIAALVDEVRMSSGVMGSAEIKTAYTNGGITIAAGWYNFIYAPHRSGGINGSTSGDNCSYGTLLLAGMTVANCFFRIRINGGSITEVTKIRETKTTNADNLVDGSASKSSVASATTNTNIGSFALSPGTWQVNVTYRFDSNASGRRYGNISSTSAGSSIANRFNVCTAPANGSATYISLSGTLQPTASTTYYVNAYQNSGSALTIAAYWTCVRIA